MDEVDEKRGAFLQIKTRIWEQHREEFLAKFGDRYYSLAEIVNSLNIPREELESYISPYLRHYDYDFALIYATTNGVQTYSTQAVQNDPYPERAPDALIAGSRIMKCNNCAA